MKTFISKYLSSSYDLLFAVLLSMFIYLSVSSFSWVWICFALLSLIAVFNKPYYILVGICMATLAIIIGHFLSPRVWTPPNDFRKDVIDYFLEGPDTYTKYAPLMFLGIKNDASKEIYDMAIEINVVHLFVISGFHIGLFFKVITWSLTKLRVPDKVAELVSLVPIVFYLFLLNFPISATRAMYLIILTTFNKNFFNKQFSNIQILSFTMGFMFLLNPHDITSYSFILTFMATYIIMIINDFKFKKKWMKSFLVTVLAYFSTLPIILSLNGYISIFGMLFGFMLTPVFIFMYVALLFLFPFKELMNYMFIGFDYMLKFIHSINITLDVSFVTKEISKYIYLLEYLVFIIYRIWNLYMVKKST